MKIYNDSHSLTQDALLCFTTAPRRVVLRPAESLYRFGSVKGGGHGIFESPWWFPETTFHEFTKTAHRTRQPIIEVARAGLAISRPWNPMDWIMIIELKEPVYGWIGPARPQPVAGRGSAAMFLGNRNQVWVPGLAEGNPKPGEAPRSDAATLRYFGDGWSLMGP